MDKIINDFKSSFTHDVTKDLIEYTADIAVEENGRISLLRLTKVVITCPKGENEHIDCPDMLNVIAQHMADSLASDYLAKIEYINSRRNILRLIIFALLSVTIIGSCMAFLTGFFNYYA